MLKPDSSQIYGILIGVDHYAQSRGGTGNASFGSLSGAVNDVSRMRAYLVNELGVPEERIQMLTASRSGGNEPLEPPEQRPTYINIAHQFQSLAMNLEDGDHVLVHYSGHGGRCPTAFPLLKGEGARDECLVPWDISTSEGRYVRDLELRYLVSLLTEKGAGVTLILDCCHAGGALRRPDEAEDFDLLVRGGQELDETRREPGRIVSEQQLSQLWPELGEPASRGIDGHSWQAAVEGAVLIAACRPCEAAFESTIDGQRSGALTHFLLETLGRAKEHWSYKLLYDVLLAKVHDRFDRQTPILEGEGNWRLLSREPCEPPRGVRITAVESQDGEQRLRLLAGAAQGIRRGATFEIFAHDHEGQLRATAQVTEVGSTSSQASLQERFCQNLPRVGDFAVMTDPGHVALRRKVAFEGPAAIRSPRALRRLKRFLEEFGQGFLELSDSVDLAELRLVVATDGQCKLKHAILGEIELPDEKLEWREDDDLRCVVERMVHWAKYQIVAELVPSDPFSPQGRALMAKCRRLSDEDGGQHRLSAPESMPLVESTDTVAEGEWLCLHLENRSKFELNFAVLSLLEDHAIEQLFPGPSDGPFTSIGPRETLALPFQMERTFAGQSSRDRLRVFSTLEPCSFRWLELPPLGEPLPGATRADTSPIGLAELCAALQGDPLERRSRAPLQALTGWAVVDLEIHVD